METEYLIIGRGAVGMAFADMLLTETEMNIIVVDKYAKLGGHWNVTTPFVTRHQLSSNPDIRSTELDLIEEYRI